MPARARAAIPASSTCSRWSADDAPISAASCAAPSHASWSACRRGTSPRALPAESTRLASPTENAVGATKASQKPASPSAAAAGTELLDHAAEPFLPASRVLGRHGVRREQGGHHRHLAGERAGHLAYHPEHPQLLLHGEAVAALHLHGGDPAREQATRAGHRAPHQRLVRGGARRPDRGEDSPARPGQALVARARREAGELLAPAPVVVEHQVGVAVDEAGRDQASPGVDLARLLQIGHLLEIRVRADPGDPPALDHDGVILQQPWVGGAEVAGGHERAADRERGAQAGHEGSRSAGIFTPRSRRDRLGFLVASVGVADDAHGGVVAKHALEALAPPPRCRRRPSPGPRAASSRCRRRRRGGSSPRRRPRPVLSSALRIGQSAMASEPSFIASVSRYGRGHRAAVEVVAADDDGRRDLARATSSLKRSPARSRSP